MQIEFYISKIEPFCLLILIFTYTYTGTIFFHTNLKALKLYNFLQQKQQKPRFKDHFLTAILKPVLNRPCFFIFREGNNSEV